MRRTKAQQKPAVKNINGYTRSVRLCDHLHKHKGAPGTVTSGESPNLHLPLVRLSDREDLQALPWRYRRCWSQFSRQKSSTRPCQYYAGTWCNFKDSSI